MIENSTKTYSRQTQGQKRASMCFMFSVRHRTAGETSPIISIKCDQEDNHSIESPKIPSTFIVEVLYHITKYR